MKKERLKELIRKYLKGKLTKDEKEHLFYLISDKNIEEAAVCELFSIWQHESDVKTKASPDKLLSNIKQNLQITEERIRKDDLILKGIEYNRNQSSQRFINMFVKYAAVFVFAVLITLVVNYMTGHLKPKEIARHEITAPAGSRIKLLLSDSTEVWLNSGSKIVYGEGFTSSDREVYLEGEAFFNVRKNNYHPFYIKTSNLSIKVLGTSFNVKSYLDEDVVETTLVTGQLEIRKVDTEGRDLQAALLLPEQKALYSKETGRIKIEQRQVLSQEPVRADKVTVIPERAEQISQASSMDIAWKDNKFVFSNEMFGSLARRLERWYNVEIEVKNEEINNFKFTGVFQDETIEQAMQAFRIASSLDYKFEKNKITIWKSDK